MVCNFLHPKHPYYRIHHNMKVCKKSGSYKTKREPFLSNLSGTNLGLDGAEALLVIRKSTWHCHKRDKAQFPCIDPMTFAYMPLHHLYQGSLLAYISGIILFVEGTQVTLNEHEDAGSVCLFGSLSWNCAIFVHLLGSPAFPRKLGRGWKH